MIPELKMVRPPSIIRFAEIILSLLTDASDLPLGIEGKETAQKGIVFQRCLAYLTSYQPAKLYSSLGKALDYPSKTS